MEIGSKVKYFNTHTRETVTGIIIASDGRRAIVKHTGDFKHYYDVEIGLFALTVI